MVTLDHVRSSPPDSPRKLNVEVPRDLEVICLKCLEKDPRRRYASAQELAADLHRWLAGEPITARPVGPLVRLAMWARRKPALAGLSAASILATLLGIAGITWQWRESVYQRNRAELARSEAIEQKGEAIHQRDLAETARAEALVSEKAAVEARTQAEQNAITAGQQAALALGAIQEMITQVNSGLDAPGLFPVKKAIVESALQRVDQVANILDQSTSKEGTTLAALIELGKIYRQTGKVNQASLIFKRCLDLAHERIKIKNNNSSSRFNLAKVHRELAYCDEELNRNMDAVVANLQDAIRLNEDILAHPTDENPTLNAAFISSVLSDLHTHLGTTYHHLGDIPKAFDEFSRAYSQRKDLLASVKNDAGQAINSNGLVRGAALSALALADCSSRLGRREAAEQYFDQAEALYQQAAQAEPGAVANQIDAGNFHAAKGNYRFRHDEWDQARDHFQKSRAQFTELATADPLNAAHRRELYAATQRLAQLADVQNQPELARKEFEEATRLAEELWRIDESNDLRKIELMMLLPHVGQTDRALTYADAFVAGEQGDMPRPIDPEQWTYLAQTYAQAARALPPEQAERALALQNQAVDAIRKAIERGFKDRTVLDHEHDLDPLRSRADFNALLESVPEPR